MSTYVFCHTSTYVIFLKQNGSYLFWQKWRLSDAAFGVYRGYGVDNVEGVHDVDGVDDIFWVYDIDLSLWYTAFRSRCREKKICYS